MELVAFRVPVPAADAGPGVWLFPVDQTTQLLDGGVDSLGEAELRRATLPADPATQRHRLLSYLLLRRVLADHLGCDSAALEFTVAPGPRETALRLRLSAAADEQVLPEFSLSRSTGLIAVAVGAGPVGVDVEDHQSPEQSAQLLRALHPTDQHQLTRLPSVLRARSVTAAWTRKEAALKALGTGLARDPARDRTGSRRRPLGPPGVRVAQLKVPRPRRAELAVAWVGY